MDPPLNVEEGSVFGSIDVVLDDLTETTRRPLERRPIDVGSIPTRGRSGNARNTPVHTQGALDARVLVDFDLGFLVGITGVGRGVGVRYWVSFGVRWGGGGGDIYLPYKVHCIRSGTSGKCTRHSHRTSSAPPLW